MARPCGTVTKARVNKVMIVWEENHSYSSVIGGGQAPVINFVARHCGLATNYHAVDHPSLPNYLEMTSGRSYFAYPWITDCDPAGGCTTPAPSIFSELVATHRQWRSYVESMGRNCGLSSYGSYAPKHNPAVYYTSVRPQCRSWDQPLGSPSSGLFHSALRNGPRWPLVTVTPNVDHDMHDGTVGEADAWLAQWLPRVVSSPAYQSGHLAVIIAWDEGYGSGDISSYAPLIVMSASTRPGTRIATAFDDYSVLRTMSQLVKVAPLGLAARASSMVAPFNL